MYYVQSTEFFFFFPFIFIGWRLITLQYCSGFCHTLTWISHGFTCVPCPNPLPPPSPSHPSGSSQCTSTKFFKCSVNTEWANELCRFWNFPVFYFEKIHLMPLFMCIISFKQCFPSSYCYGINFLLEKFFDLKMMNRTMSKGS